MDNNSLSFLGNWSSIIGLAITVFVAIIGYIINNKIKEIQRELLFSARIKSLIKNLDKSKSNYPKYLQDYQNSQSQIRFEISQTEVILKTILKKVTNNEKKTLNKLIDQIKIMKSGYFIYEQQRKKGIWISMKHVFVKNNEISEKDVWTFYTDLSALQTQLENLVEDKKIKNYGRN